MPDAIEARTSLLNEANPRSEGDYVLYWMEHSQRAEANPALERAIARANALKLPLLVLFVVDPDYPEGNARHFTFMLEGLKETMAALRQRGAHFSLRKGKPPEIAADVARRAAVVVTDRGYLRHLVDWRKAVAEDCGCLMEMVEGDVIVPVEAVSPKMETAARTIRPKIHKALKDYTELPGTAKPKVKAERLGSNQDLHLDDVAAFVESLGCDASVGPIDHTKGGLSNARKRLKAFLKDDLPDYAEGRSDIVNRHVSMLSAYLHLGQISPLEVYHAVRAAETKAENADAFIEEMMVRRELAVNFVHYNKDYDRWQGLPEWARNTLKQHQDDERPATYGPKTLEQGKTDDPYWNAAMKEMRVTGYLHNHMRMYWGKRILGWSKNPQDGYKTTLRLNNKYFLDGRDCNSYANVGWLYGLHDRGWPERDVYGKVRIMMPSGLKRKFDVDAYVRWAESL
jgi:deoxyribodipyrimidine photo-lyase